MPRRKSKNKKSTTKSHSEQKFRSPLEKRLAERLKGFKYEPCKMAYITERNYIPDFVDEDRQILIEAKGFFRQGDDKKYLSIKKCYPKWRMIFVFSDPKKPVRKGGLPRKDGTRLSLAEWADQNGWEWCSESSLPEDIM